MPKQKQLIITGLFLVAMLANANAKEDGAYLRDVTDRLATPHLAWATPLAQPLKVLFIVPRVLAAREVAELRQRIAIEATAFTCYHSGQMASDDVYDGAIEGTSTAEKTAELMAKLSDRYDVIVFGNVGFDTLPAKAKYRVLKQVTEGTGLVFFYAPANSHSKLFSKPHPTKPDILNLVSWAGLPRPLREQKMESILKAYSLGKGRVVVLDYPGRHGTLYGGLSLTQNEGYGPFWRAHYENNLVLAARTIRWAAGRQPSITVENKTFADGTVFPQPQTAGKVIDLVLSGATPQGHDLAVRLRDEWNEIRLSQKQTMTDRNRALSIQLPFLPGGTYYLDVVASSGRGVEDFGYFSFTVEPAVGHVTLTTDKSDYDTGQTIRATLTLQRPAVRETTVRTLLKDSPFGRIWKRQAVRVPSGARAVSFAMAVEDDFPTLAGTLQAEVLDDQNVGVRQETTVFFPRQARELFPSITWDAVSEYLPEAVAAQLHRAGFNACLTGLSPGGENAKLNAVFNFRLIPYVYRVGITANEKGWATMQWSEKQAFADGSIYNPAVQAELRKSLQQRIANLSRYSPLVYSLGDENYFTYEAGYSPSEEKAFRDFLKVRYGAIENLNREWHTSFPSFADVSHYSQKQLREEKKYAAWNDHRMFVEKEYADFHHLLARWIKEVDPRARVGAEGSLSGDLERTVDGLEFWGPYIDTVTNELLRSVAPEKLRSNWWGGYSVQRGDPMAVLWDPLVRGAINASSWYTIGPNSEGFMSCDLSYAKYFQDLFPALRKTLQGSGPLLANTPLKRGQIALLWSHRSVSSSVMAGQFFNPSDGAEVLIRFCDHYGYPFDIVTSRMAEEGKLNDYKILFLFGASALADKECQAIEAFTRLGGVVVADLNPGILNSYCRPLGSSQLANLFAAPLLKGMAAFTLAPVRVDQAVRGKRISLTAEKALTSAESSIFRVNPYGKGLAILLNFGLSTAADTSPPAAFDTFLSGLLDIASVSAPMRVEGIARENLLIRLRETRDLELLSLLVKKSNAGNTLNVLLPEKRFVYRVDGSPVGHTDHWAQALTEPLMVFGLFKGPQAEPRLAIGQKTVQPGHVLSLPVSLSGQNRVVRLELIAPRGTPVATYPKMLFFEAKEKTLCLPFAFNDAPGRYQITVTDVASGLHSEVNVDLVPAPGSEHSQDIVKHGYTSGGRQSLVRSAEGR